LKKEPFLCFSEGYGYRGKLEAWYKDQNITPQKVKEFGTLETNLGSVTMGLGITFVQKLADYHLEEKGLVKCHYLPEKYSEINTVLIRRKDAYLTSTLEKFIETIEHNEGEPAYPLAF